MDRFSKYNPKATLLYFICIVSATLIIFNPVFLSVSLVAALCYRLVISGRSAFVYFLKLVLPLILLAALFNMIFVHKGVTVLFTVFDISFTAEALFYGFNQGMLLGAVIMWLSCYNEVISAEALISVFGRVSPNITLVFAMTLTFIPRLRKNLSEINDARMLISTESSRMKKAIGNISALVTMTLEESIETANSMKARGFSSKRTVYSKYRFSIRDAVVIAVEIVMLGMCIYAKASGGTQFIFEPVITMTDFSIVGIAAFVVLAFMPTAIEAMENIKWQLLKQKI